MLYDMIIDFTPILLGLIFAFALGRYVGYNVCRAIRS